MNNIIVKKLIFTVVTVAIIVFSLCGMVSFADGEDSFAAEVGILSATDTYTDSNQNEITVKVTTEVTSATGTEEAGTATSEISTEEAGTEIAEGDVLQTDELQAEEGTVPGDIIATGTVDVLHEQSEIDYVSNSSTSTNVQIKFDDDVSKYFADDRTEELMLASYADSDNPDWAYSYLDSNNYNSITNTVNFTLAGLKNWLISVVERFRSIDIITEEITDQANLDIGTKYEFIADDLDSNSAIAQMPSDSAQLTYIGQKCASMDMDEIADTYEAAGSDEYDLNWMRKKGDESKFDEEIGYIYNCYKWYIDNGYTKYEYVDFCNAAKTYLDSGRTDSDLNVLLNVINFGSKAQFMQYLNNFCDADYPISQTPGFVYVNKRGNAFDSCTEGFINYDNELGKWLYCCGYGGVGQNPDNSYHLYKIEEAEFSHSNLRFQLNGKITPPTEGTATIDKNIIRVGINIGGKNYTIPEFEIIDGTYSKNDNNITVSINGIYYTLNIFDIDIFVPVKSALDNNPYIHNISIPQKAEEYIKVNDEKNGEHYISAINGKTIEITAIDNSGNEFFPDKVTFESINKVLENGAVRAAVKMTSRLTVKVNLENIKTVGYSDVVVVQKSDEIVSIMNGDKEIMNVDSGALLDDTQGHVTVDFIGDIVVVYYDDAEIFRVDLINGADEHYSIKLEDNILRVYDNAGSVLTEATKN